MIIYAKDGHGEEVLLGDYRLVVGDVDFMEAWRNLYTPEERELIATAGEIQNWQLGEGPLPQGMDAEQAAVFMSAVVFRELAARANKLFVANGGEGLALIGSLGVDSSYKG